MPCLLGHFVGVTIFQADLGLVGVWISFIADEWLRRLLMLWRWRSKVWQKKSFVQQSVETA